MTIDPNIPTLTDAKRAAALVVHYGRQDVEGVNEVLRQISEEEDNYAATARLVFGMMDLYAGIMPMLHTARGLSLLTQMVVDIANAELPEDQQ